MRDEPRPTMRRVAWTALRYGLVLVLLGLVARQLLGHRDELAARELSLSPGFAVLSGVGLMVFLFLSGDGWRRVACALGARLTPRESARIVFLSNLAKYLPGGVWSLVGRVAMARRHGLGAVEGSVSVLLEAALHLASGTLVALVALRLGSAHPVLGDARLVALAAAVIVVGLHPRLINAVFALAERVARRKLPRLPFTYRFVLSMLAYYVACWALIGLGFAALAQALRPEPLAGAEVLVLAGGFALAWNAGILAFFLPGGLGVRELLLLAILGVAFDGAFPATMALTARVWVTLGEVLAFVVAASLPRAPDAVSEPAAAP